MTKSNLTPAVFLGHGSPMNALEVNRYTSVWRAIGTSMPKPRAVLVVSAHWYTSVTAVTAMPRPRTIHDFFGFTQALNDVQYPAPGSPELAAEVKEVLRPRWVGLDEEAWGLDHGAWSVLLHVFPQADVPVLQLSINGTKPLEENFELGRRLAPLRERGVLVVCSGNIVHNLRRWNPSRPDEAFDWAKRFDEAARQVLTTDPSNVLSLTSHPDYAMAVPTPDHFAPLLHLAGLAAEAGRPLDVLVDGYSGGAISMTCLGLDTVCPPPAEGPAAATLPKPGSVPSDETNL